jgi:hypothetical protein
MFTLSRCTSAELYFSCCGSVVALPALANCSDHVAETNIRNHARQHPARFARRPQLERLEWLNHLFLVFGIHARVPPEFPVSRAKLTKGFFFTFLLLPPPRPAPPFFFRVLPALRLFLRARLRTCRLASAVTGWAPSFGRWFATSTASAAAVGFAATTTRSSTAPTCFTKRPRATLRLGIVALELIFSSNGSLF